MPTVLIVDDNLLNLELAADVLELAGFDVMMASSGRESIEKAEQAIPDLVLMDLRMPEMSGLEAMQALHNNQITSNIPVAVLTASAMKGDEERLLQSGFSAYLQKPIDPSRFADQVTELIK
ncbi:MAG: response regulator [Mariprofundaceae bacterium]|nr:response regulator [Mariprofundaceae bacterium]